MRDETNYKRVVNYFQKWEGAGMLGVGLLAGGALCLWMGPMFSWILYMIGGPMIGVGAVIFLYGSIGRASEAEIREQIPRYKEKITFPELEEDILMHRRTPNNYEIMEFQGYVLKEGNFIKKTKDASLISSEYELAKVAVIKDAYYVKTLLFSFVEKKETSAVYDIKFTDITDFSVEREKEYITVGKNRFLAKRCYLVISYGEGQQLRLPANDDILTDEMAENLKRKHGLGQK